MIKFLLNLFFTEEYIWRNKDNDIPVEFIEVAGKANGREYAKVRYDGMNSYVPMDELVIVRKWP